MAKKNTAGPSQVSHRRYADINDGVLDTDSEDDEFDTYGSKTRQSEDDDIEDDEGEDTDDSGTLESAFGEPVSDDEAGHGVAQWEPDEWDGAGDDDDDDDETDSEPGAGEEVELKKLQRGLNDIPLSTLIKAERSLRRTIDTSSHPQGPSSERERKLAAARARLAEMQHRKGKALGVTSTVENEGGSSLWTDREIGEEKERQERIKRDNKHAPTAISTKKQVSRHRQVVDVKKDARRDPRFTSLSAGQVDAHLHAQAYDFMPDLLKEEYSSLRTAVTAALKAERTCKLAEKPRFTAERERLEGDLSRVRTRLDRLQRENRERDVLSRVKRDELAKRADGKGEWYMKKSEKRELLLKARFESLEQQGGKRAVKKVMDKKMKKVASKEKKSRPFAPGAGGRDARETGGGRDGKRRRVA